MLLIVTVINANHPIALYSPVMTYFKGVLIGLATVLAGCVVAPFAMVFWASRKSPREAVTISYSPMGLAEHLAHSLTFWVFFLVLFGLGFLPYVLSRPHRR